MYNLVVDIGNSRVKCAIFIKKSIKKVYQAEQLNSSLLDTILSDFPDTTRAIISSVGRSVDTEIELLKLRLSTVIHYNSTMHSIIDNCYKTPETLGSDRLAAAIGAEFLYPKQAKLVIDAGSAITIDYIDEHSKFLGGVISPGLSMRYRALNHFTGKLPLENISDNFNIIGGETSEAIVSGVQNGTIFELEGYINYYVNKNRDLSVILTGGDSNFFEKRLKNPIFANLHLVLVGLNHVLENSDLNMGMFD